MSTRQNRERRRHPRYSCKSIALQVGWQGLDGNARMGLVRAVNISESGICLELPDDALPNSMVRLHAQKHLRLHGLGSIRYRHRMGHTVRVGIEFIDGLRWVPPAEPNESFAGGLLKGKPS